MHATIVSIDNLTTLVVIAVHNWVGLLIATPAPLAACLSPSGTVTESQ